MKASFGCLYGWTEGPTRHVVALDVAEVLTVSWSSIHARRWTVNGQNLSLGVFVPIIALAVSSVKDSVIL
jgi:hypothetical protein